MSLQEDFAAFIQKEQLFHLKDRLLIAVSGGVDSIVLCELCHQLQFNFTMAHCNFQLRSDESERDEQFVRKLAHQYGANIFVKRFDTAKYAREQKISIQVAARELRYNWFYELVNTNGGSLNREEARAGTGISNGDVDAPHESGEPAAINGIAQGKEQPVKGSARYILTAHHADDNIETVLMNFFKGTGIAGIRGILPKQGKIIRPLLFAYKADISRFAEEQGLQYVEDSSNASDKYTRNFFRHQVIPLAKTVYPALKENIANNITRFSETEQLYKQAISHHKKKLLEHKGNEVHIPVLKWSKVVPLETITYEIIKDFGFTAVQAKEVISLMNSESGKLVQSRNYRIIKNRNWMIIAPLKTEEAENILINESDKEIVFETGVLNMKTLPAAHCHLSPAPGTAQLNAQEIRFPLLLRKRKQGDYFYPLGMNRKKKISRFLTDLKLSTTEKENTWILESASKIAWVVGRRIDNRFRMVPASDTVLQITFTPAGER